MSTEPILENSIVHSQYEPSERPVSKRELADNLKYFMRKNKISDEMVFHTKTKYFYHVKKFGKKEQEILANKKENNEKYNVDIGNCSVSWKIKKTPYEIRKQAIDVVKEYMFQFEEEKINELTHYKVELAKVFYTWLYLENYE